jgi:hypothetical protein
MVEAAGAVGVLMGSFGTPSLLIFLEGLTVGEVIRSRRIVS